MARLDDDLSHPRVLLRPCLLLLLAEQPGHGYDLVDRLRSLGFDWGGAGPLYQTLRRLEAAGLVVSSWDASEAGPARRTYRLTTLGWETLRASTRGLDRLTRLLDDFRIRFNAALATAPGDPVGADSSEPDPRPGPEVQAGQVVSLIDDGRASGEGPDT